MTADRVKTGTLATELATRDALSHAYRDLAAAFAATWPRASEAVPARAGALRSNYVPETRFYDRARDERIGELLAFIAASPFLTDTGLEMGLDRVIGQMRARAESVLAVVLATRAERQGG